MIVNDEPRFDDRPMIGPQFHLVFTGGPAGQFGLMLVSEVMVDAAGRPHFIGRPIGMQAWPSPQAQLEQPVPPTATPKPRPTHLRLVQ